MSSSFVTSAVSLEVLPKDGQPQVAMVGRSNVGKSSLINHLTERKNLARVSSSPGRTRTINLYNIDERFYLVDLPGYGYAKTSKTNRENFLALLQAYLLQTSSLKLVLLVIDARIPLSDLDMATAEWLQGIQVPFAIVLNKVDKVKKTDLDRLDLALEARFPGILRLPHSFISADQRAGILQAVERFIK